MQTNERDGIDLDPEDGEDELRSGAKYLLFQLGQELHGVAIACVTEIIELQKITPIPDVPGYVRGVINLRGRVIPVMDLRLRFGMPERAYDDRTCMVIVRLGDRAVGMVVDTVAEVHEIPERDIEGPPAFATAGQESRYVSGLAKVGDRLVVLVDPARLATSAELAGVETAPVSSP